MPTFLRPVLRVLGLLSLSFLLPIALMLAWLFYDDHQHELERQTIHGMLERIPGVATVSTGVSVGNKPATFATVTLRSGGKVSFWRLKADSFSATRQLLVDTAGGLMPRFVVHGCVGVYDGRTGLPLRSLAMGSGLDVGPGGPMTTLLGGPLDSVSSVISNYEKLVQVLRSLPPCPSSIPLEDSAGNEYRYCVGPERTYVDPEFPASWWNSDSCGEAAHSHLALIPTVPETGAPQTGWFRDR